MSDLAGRTPAHSSREMRRYPWQVRDSGQVLLVVAAGVWLVAAVAQTAAEGLKDPRIAIAFGALIAFGEVLRLNLPGDVPFERQVTPADSREAPVETPTETPSEAPPPQPTDSP